MFVFRALTYMGIVKREDCDIVRGSFLVKSKYANPRLAYKSIKSGLDMPRISACG